MAHKPIYDPEAHWAAFRSVDSALRPERGFTHMGDAGYMDISLANLAEVLRPQEKADVRGAERLCRADWGVDIESRAIARLPIASDGGDPSFPIQDWPAAILRFDDALVTSTGNIVQDDVCFAESVRPIRPEWQKYGFGESLVGELGFRSYDPHSKTAFVALHEPDHSVVSVEAPCFVLHHKAGAVNFAHFLHDFALQILAFEEASRLAGRRLKPVIRYSAERNGSSSPFQYPVLTLLFRELFGSEEDVVWLNGNAIRAREVFTSTPLFRPDIPAVSLSSVHFLRDRIHKAVAKFAPGGRLSVPRVWIRRNDANNVYALNGLDAAEQLATTFGFAGVSVSRLTPEDIFEVFGHAQVVGGLHGAGLMNLVFSRRIESVIECMYAGWTYESLATLSSAWGAHVSRIPVEWSATKELSISLSELSAALKRL